MEYAVGVADSGAIQERYVAYFSIGSFVVIFTVAILWATRPESKRDAQTHGTTRRPGSTFDQ